MTLLADLVATSAAIADTPARSAKIALLSELLARLKPDELPAGVGFLSGSPRQGKIGVGWSTIYRLDVAHATEPSIEILDLDRVIDEVQATTGSGSAGLRRTALEELMKRATREEADFVRRLFVGELRQGALAGVMAEAIAKASGLPATTVRRALMLAGDLPLVAQIALTEGEAGLSAVGFEIFRPILPMLASTAADVATALNGFEVASVEWKLDGIRVQIHRRGENVRIYTRNLNDITEPLPGIVEAIRALPVEHAVFDGEAIGLGPEDSPFAFQETMASIDNEKPAGVVTFLFDVLHLEGTDFLDAPLQERLAVLDSIAPHLRIPGVITSSVDEADVVLNDSLAAGHEGVVVKDVTSTYIAGRRGKAWRKVKPHRTFDLVVLGAEWGHGRRQGWLSNLHLGARDPSGGFVMVGKCFKGLTDELLSWQTRELLERETERSGIFVRVRPELVVEVAIDGVLVSPRYAGGLALRFARVRRYRPDKNAEEADTIDELRTLLRRNGPGD